MAAPRLHALELDLDVFAGPFDLLCSLILREDETALEEVLEAGAAKARAIAAATLADVRDAMGVGPVRRATLRPAG